MTKYIIRKTSTWDDEQPCEGAIQEELNCFDIRTCSKESLLERNIISKDEYLDYENFINIKYNDETWCKKPIVNKLWTIEIDDLQKFCEELDEKIIIFPKGYDPEYPYPEIEIYDYWRE